MYIDLYNLMMNKWHGALSGHLQVFINNPHQNQHKNRGDWINALQPNLTKLHTASKQLISG